MAALHRHTRKIFALSLLLTALALYFLLRSADRSSERQAEITADFPAVNAAGEPLLAVVSGAPIYGDETTAEAGLAYEPPLKIVDFTLNSQNGTPVSLADYRGKFLLLFFGYTHCPDVCPLTMDGFRRVYEGLTEAERQRLDFLFISVDEQRDTPARLREYLAHFDAPITALYGDESEIARIGEPFGLVWRVIDADTMATKDMGSAAGHRQDHALAPGDYLLDHTSSRFLLDKNGRLIRRYLYSPDPATSASRMLADLRPLLAQPAQPE